MKIAEIEAGGGKIAISPCPGTRFSAAAVDIPARQLTLDLDAISAWGAKLVVSAVPQDELADMGVANLPEAVEARGIEWHHLAIEDYGIPDAVCEARWLWTATRSQRVLADGGGVLFHCAAGIGRSATLAARLLCELGASAQDAIRQVRAVRPGAINIDAQQQYVEQWGRPTVTSVRPDSPPTRVERALGCLLGGAVGDGFGYAIEFDSLAQVHKRLGARGLVAPQLDSAGRLVVSDDTQMTLFTLEGLLHAAGHPPAADFAAAVTGIWRSYQRWFETQGGVPAIDYGSRGWLMDDPRLRHRRAPGNTCLSGLASHHMGSVQRRLNNSKGCGGVMRTAPIGLWAGCQDAPHAYDLGVRTSALTHGHPTGFHAGGAMAAMVFALTQSADIRAAAGIARELAASSNEAAEVTSAIDDALAAARNGASTPAGGLGQGWIAEEALAIGLWAALTGRDFAHTLVIAANHDGDSDSTASIAGQIRGTAEGIQCVPPAWARRLDVLDPLLRLALEMISRT